MWFTNEISRAVTSSLTTNENSCIRVKCTRKGTFLPYRDFLFLSKDQCHSAADLCANWDKISRSQGNGQDSGEVERMVLRRDHRLQVECFREVFLVVVVVVDD